MNPKPNRPMEVYALMEHWMRIAAVVFAILAATSGFWAYRLSQLKSEAAKFETRWSDAQNGVAAVRFSFRANSLDLGYMFSTLHIDVIRGPKSIENPDIGILGRETDVYLPPGSYKLEFSTRLYETKVETLDIPEDGVGKRMWMDLNLLRKN